MSQNNDNSAAGAGVAIVVGLFAMLAAMIAIGLAFLAFVFTILCAAVWVFDRPISLGRVSITPDEARAFILRGIAGAVLLPSFALFAIVFFGVPFRDDAWEYLILGGYVGGSIGVEILFANQAAQFGEATPPQVMEHQPSRPALPAPKSERSAPGEPAPGFRFASWDDEEELRR